MVMPHQSKDDISKSIVDINRYFICFQKSLGSLIFSLPQMEAGNIYMKFPDVQ